MRHSSDLITVLGADGRIVYQSPSSLAVLGFDPDELTGTRFEALLAPGDSTRLIQILGDGSAREAGQTEVLQAALRHHDGTVLQFEIQYTNLLEDEHVNGIVLNARDISERAQFEEQLSHQAFHDPVTGLANRALFGERVRHASARALREGGGVGVVFLDLDDFKTVNDSLGHAAGDEVLTEFAKRLESVIRASDTAARFGGDEFAILLESVSSADDAVETVDRVLEAMSVPLRVGHKELVLRASMGVSLAEPGTVVEAEELIRNADAAMYNAKRDGKGGYRLFEPRMHESVLARLELRADLQRALVNDEFELHYQPVVRLHDGSVSGVEALVRWRHPERGLVAPGRLHPVRRGDRPHRPDRPLGPARGVPHGARAAADAPGRRAAHDGDQPLREAAPALRRGRRRPRRARRVRPRALPPDARDHRDGPHGRRGPRRAPARGAQGARASASRSTTSAPATRR